MDVAVPIARPSHIEGDLHVEAHADHIVLRLPAQRHEDLDWRRIGAPEAQMEDAVQEVEELRARVRERFWIDPVVDSENISDGVELGIVARETVEDQVPTGNVPLWGIEESAVLEAFLSEVVHFLQERKVDPTQRPRADPRGEGQHGVVFAPGSSEIVEGQGADVPALLLRPPQCDRRIDAAREEDDRAFHGRAVYRCRDARRAAPGRRLPTHKYLSQAHPSRVRGDLKRPGAGVGGTGPTGPRVRPRFPRSVRPATERAARRTGRAGP